MVVYEARNKVNGKVYVGKTIFTLAKRRQEHEALALRGNPSAVFLRALRKYGFDAFKWRVLVIEDNDDDLNESERVCIKALKTRVPGGYNLTDGGDGGQGYKHTKESRDKISKACIGKPAPNKGIPHTRETKKKISEAAKGRVAWNKGVPSGETTVPKGCSFKGRKHTDEAKAKMKIGCAKRPKPSSEAIMKTKTTKRVKFWIKRLQKKWQTMQHEGRVLWG